MLFFAVLKKVHSVLFWHLFPFGYTKLNLKSTQCTFLMNFGKLWDFSLNFSKISIFGGFARL